MQSWGYLKIIDSTGGGKVTSAVYNQGVIFTNADINHDGYITQDDIDAVVKLIMETMNNKENE